MGETKSINTVGGGEFSGGDDVGFGIGGDDGSVDGTAHIAAFDGDCDLLGNGLADGGGLMDGGIRVAAAAVHLKRGGAESANDESAASVGGAIEVIFLIGSHAGAADDDAVGVRVSIEVHELRLVKGGFDGVVARSFAGGIPIGGGGAGDDVDGAAFLGKFRVINGFAPLRFVGVDFASPAGDGHPAAGNAARAFILGGAKDGEHQENCF